MESFKNYITSFWKGLWSLLVGMKVTGKEFVTPKVTFRSLLRRKDNVKIYFAVCRPQDLSFYADNFVEKSGAGYSRSCSLPLFFRSSSSSFTRRGFQMKVFDSVPAFSRSMFLRWV